MANLKLVKSATALVLGASVLTSAVAVSGTDASAKTTYKVTKAGTLVNAKTNKAVKGYKSYKGKLYKNGKKLTGTYKSVFYKSGVKFTGTYNKKYYVKGKLFTGKTSKNVYYKKGVKFTGVTSYGYTYKDGKRVEGEYKGKVYKNGKLLTGLYKDVLYKKGVKETGLDLYKDKLYNEGVLNVGLALFQEKLYNNADLATGIFTYNGVEDQYKDGVVVPTKVESASAVNSTTIELKGTNLHGTKLTAADITVANNTVKDVTFSADRTTATVTLKDKLAVDNATKVTVKDAAFDVTYKVVAKTVSVVEKTYDDDTKDQFVKVAIDGKEVTAQELIDAGYNVEFTSFAKKSGTKVTGLFAGTSATSTSTTGLLATTLSDTTAGTSLLAQLNTAGVLESVKLPTAGVEVYVQVKLSKGTETISSEVQKIKIQNIDLATQSIDAYTLENFGAPSGTPTAVVTDDGTANTTTGVSVGGTGNNDFVQNSTTLVTGEKAALRNITISNDGKKELAKYADNLISVKSSDSSVISVKDGVLTAQAPGTATITIAYGTKTKEVTFTVTNTKRELNKATIVKDDAAIASTTLVKAAGSQTFDGVVYDQYGDPISSPVTAKITNDSSVKRAASVTATAGTDTETVTPGADGEFTINLTPENAGTATVTFHDAAGNKLTNSQLRVNVTENANLSYYKLFTINSTVDTVLDSLDTSDDSAEIVTKSFTSENNDLGKVTFNSTTPSAATGTSPAVYVPKIIKSTATNTETTGYTVKWSESKVGLVDTTAPHTDGVYVIDATGNLAFDTVAGKTGTVTVTVIDNATNKEASITYTVNANGINVKGAALKTIAAPTFDKTIDYKDVLDFTLQQGDTLVKGLELTKATEQPVRLALANGTGIAKGDLYIDKNANGTFEDGKDVIVGKLDVTSTGSIAATNATGFAYDAVAGIAVKTGDKGTIIYKVIDKNGNVVAKSSVEVDF